MIINLSLEELAKVNYQVHLWIYKTELPLLLLKRLADKGDNRALQLIKEIILDIIQTNSILNLEMLYDGGYINFLSRDEFWSIFGEDGKIMHEFEKKIKQSKMVTYKSSSGTNIAGKEIKTKEAYCYFNLSNGIYIDYGPMVFTFESGYITGIGIWSDDKNILEINQLPEALFELTFLKELILFNVKLKEIPSNIKDFQSLKSLSLSENLLSSIPKEICELKCLEYLELGWNNLTSLPTCIDNLKYLQKIHIFNNPLNKQTKIFLNELKKKTNLVLYLNSY